MKTIIKIAISVLVLVACVNVGRALMDEYRFEDKVHDALLFDARMTDAEIIKMVLETAAEYDIPIAASDIEINQRGPDIHVDMSYTTDVVIIPGVLSQPWTFTPSASTRVLVGNRRKPS
jgi:hypothetical protein